MASSWHGVFVDAFVFCWSGIRVDDHYSFQLRVRNREATIRGPRDVGRCGHEISKVAIQKTGFPLSQDVVVLRVKNRARSEEVRRAFQTSPLLAPSPSPKAAADGAADPVTDLSLVVPLLPQTCPTTDGLAPSWMGDTGFQDEHIGAWRRAETQFD